MPIRAYIFGRFSSKSYQKVMNLTSEYEELSAKELVEIYNKWYETGFFGAYSQGLHFAAVHNAFIEKFGVESLSYGGFVHRIYKGDCVDGRRELVLYGAKD